MGFMRSARKSIARVIQVAIHTVHGILFFATSTEDTRIHFPPESRKVLRLSVLSFV